MTTSKINNNNSYWVPKAISTAALGTTIAATSNGFLTVFGSHWSRGLVQDFVKFSCIAASIAGTVVAVYSMVRLCQKAVSEKNELHKNITVTALGVLGTALALTIANHFWEIAPTFCRSHRYSMAFCIGTTFAWQVCAIVGLGSIAFTAYAAYLTGRAILATTNPAIANLIN